LAINPNTVLKAYQLLEQQGLVEGRQGQGTFVTAALPGPSPARQATLRRGLDRWLQSAFEAGLDDEGILAIVETALRDQGEEQTA
jgi:GntR family transcriptional regulator